ncbi:MAG TPA: tRNA (adenosine(37)-N6)-threonylcarbamoyltransferase complex transferase subunit TsaD [Alphaproteobacteria bacterium]
MTILGIETSCDETAVALVRSDRTIVSQRVLSQLKDHLPYGGVVPEIAARAHVDHLDGLIKEVMDEAALTYDDIDAIAATSGPGLIGGVMVGLMTAKGLSLATGKPFLGINHIEAHALSPRLSPGVEFPYLLLLVSGGHCQIVWVNHVGAYQLLGHTIDDAVGEAFDKVAKLLGLPYPGGPALEKLARQSKSVSSPRFHLPLPLCGKPGADFSFAGLKTAARLLIPELQSEEDRAEFARTFHHTISAIFADRLKNALKMAPEAPKRLVVAGGVAANQYLRDDLQAFCDANNMEFYAPPMWLCTDNAAMIAWAALERFAHGQTDELDLAARPRWPLVEMTGFAQDAA